MTKYNASYKLLLAAWLAFCGFIVGGLMWVLMRDVWLAVLLGVVAVPFIWVLSLGWWHADLFERALRLRTGERTGRDA